LTFTFSLAKDSIISDIYPSIGYIFTFKIEGILGAIQPCKGLPFLAGGSNVRPSNKRNSISAEEFGQSGMENRLSSHLIQSICITPLL
jgi:hypothetical protein